ncbi:molybdate ABC transporter substrate-binding protein [Aeropyrum camini]|uniref:molybdate ABC transporter substrate-binding protein n=1 Tax=Aeropyrum camini TaxID=229980 RepID=UPI00130E214C|nr:molybdate ABC transporter substrate-binding protein [Aeropyrum camini]
MLLLLSISLVTAVAFTVFYSDGSVQAVVFADRTLQKPLEEILSSFSQERGVEVSYVYGSSGFVLAQLELRGSGDLYVSDGWEFAVKGLEEGLLDEDYFEVVGCIRLALIVAEGNPLGVSSLRDALLRDDVVVALGNPEHVTAGVLAWELLEELGLEETVLKKVGDGGVVLVDSASQAAYYVVMGLADAAVTFNVYTNLMGEGVDEVYDPAVASVKAPVVVALPVNRGPLAEDLFNFVLGHSYVFADYGVEVGGSC